VILKLQDRAHRIGQTREVHVYRLVSAMTVEENILRRANWKRKVERVVTREGSLMIILI
jgi:SNF2 family DNA or RNA helicase